MQSEYAREVGRREECVKEEEGSVQGGCAQRKSGEWVAGGGERDDVQGSLSLAGLEWSWKKLLALADFCTLPCSCH